MLRIQCYLATLLFPFAAYASFIESTIGTAIVNDATATYYNPAALTLTKNKQFIALGSLGRSDTTFSGTVIQKRRDSIQNGTTKTRVNFLLPSGYYAMPLKTNWRLGFAVIANDFNKDLDGFSILRYSQSDNKIENIDLVPAIAYKFNEYISFGASINHSYAHFLLKPITGLPRLNIPDGESINESSAKALGKDAGFLLKPAKGTLVGFNYRSAMTFKMRGSSIFNNNPTLSSDNYHFNYWIPARSALSISHFLTNKLGLMGTVQYIQWNIFKENTIHNVATAAGVISSVKVPYYLRNSWLFTAGTNYRFYPKWIIRMAASYLQSPSNGKFQIDHGDSITLGASMAYSLGKKLILNASYAHAFFKAKNINIVTAQNTINGIDKGNVNSISLKITANL
ncbi:MAG: outer membrane protein transport protein [Tatlockia sp.]|nr:outer membrane protein transport protein [Tatlockia sp.]